eukprot:TRINITY_DN6205_c0_g1_i2.p1 TRINITY_DN6205_c0_g1~~TRINITY_DN6205_c0_g1_i2.p1  ORF type:complete len:447 (+),score=90.60 TRINITY_DN6205_c0_g1_i2:43-1341(+)
MASLSAIAKEDQPIDDIDDLVEQGYLTEEEKHVLKRFRQDDRAHVLWCWITSLASETLEMLKVPPPNINMLYHQIRIGLNGIHVIHQHVKTQLPFPYVHMITLLVNIHNVSMAVVAGIKVSIAVKQGMALTAFIELIQVIIVPTMYEGLLLICMFISDPFGDDIIDFPVMEMQMESNDACMAFLTTARELYKERRSRAVSPLPQASFIEKLPPLESVLSERDTKVAELKEALAKRALNGDDSPRKGWWAPDEKDEKVPAEDTPTTADTLGTPTIQEQQCVALAPLPDLDAERSALDERQEAFLKSLCDSAGSQKALELAQWLREVQQHMAKMPPMPRAATGLPLISEDALRYVAAMEERFPSIMQEVQASSMPLPKFADADEASSMPLPKFADAKEVAVFAPPPRQRVESDGSAETVSPEGASLSSYTYSSV